MLVVPLRKPVTIPVPAPTLAMVGLVLLHAPPGVALVSVIGVDKQTALPPALGVIGFTVIAAIAVQPLVNVYDTLATPDDTPVTMPEDAPIDAIPGASLVQVPPALALVRVITELTQTRDKPVTGDKRLTVSEKVTLQPDPPNV
jgi:hypothetical protein